MEEYFRLLTVHQKFHEAGRCFLPEIAARSGAVDSLTVSGSFFGV